MFVLNTLYGGLWQMQGTQKPPANKRRFYTSPRVLCILGFVFTYLIGLATFAPQVSAATLSAPGGNTSDPVVRQVDVARPAVVRIVTLIDGQLTVHFTASVTASFPTNGGSYPIGMSGSGAFISAHGEILTADHVVNPPRGQDLDDALYTYAAQDVADYINTHFQVSAPYSASDAYSVLASGSLPSSTSYDQPKSEVYLSTSYAGAINATKLDAVPAADRAAVDKIEAQSSFSANDVAIIHVSGMDNMPSIQLGDSSQVAEQDNLTVIGYPGLGDISEAPTTFLTSSINKVYVSALKQTDGGAPVIQVGGNVEHGDSGGPALDDKGAIIGIVSFGYSGINGDYGQTSFLQASNSAEALIKSLGISTAPGTFESAWAQAMNDYAASDADHWQKAAQELQSLTRSYPNFLGAASYLTYAQNQATHGQASSTGLGTNSAWWIVALIVLLLLILGACFYVLFRKNTQTVVVAPGSAQYPSGMYGAYPQQLGAYPPAPANYSAGVPYAQLLPGMQQGPLAGAAYPNYTSPATYGALPGQVPQTPQPTPDVTQLPQPVLAQGQNAAFSLSPVQTPQPVEYEAAQQSMPGGPQSEQVPISSSSVDLATPLPSGDSWPVIVVEEEEK
jgi:S1-C subfamily serine protease